MRTEVTILFSDIKGSTSYFERNGDAEGLAMVQHHNDLLFPVIEEAGGRVVKTIGDAIMACFKDPAVAVKAAIRMQQVMSEDRGKMQFPDERIHVRIALHMGLGLEKDNDVYGDVVNTAAKVQQQTEPDQILITEALLSATRQAGARCVKLGRAEVKGKDEAVNVYAVAWSDAVGEQLFDEQQRQFDTKLRETRRQKDEMESELEAAREQWRNERRRLTTEIEELEAEVEHVREGASQKVPEELQAQARFKLDEAARAKEQADQERAAAEARWETERARLRAQIETLQGAALQAMEQSHNPTRFALAVREQVDARIKEARKDWEFQWEGERKRLTTEIERLKKAGNIDEDKEEKRRAILQKLGKLPAESGMKSTGDIHKEFAAAKAQWESERDDLKLRVQQLERQLQQDKDAIRQDVFHELSSQYEPRIEAYEYERRRLREDLEAANAQFADERQRFNARIEQLERSIPEAQEAVRVQMIAELEADFESKMDEVNRAKLRNERRAQDAADEAEATLRRSSKEIARLQDELKEARDAVFRAQRGGRMPTPAPSNS
jgi:class 3 adenylate cyclase